MKRIISQCFYYVKKAKKEKEKSNGWSSADNQVNRKEKRICCLDAGIEKAGTF